jgi:hypothetical protein
MKTEHDVGFINDAFDLIADLYCAENHAINSYNETKEEIWLEIAEMCRKDRGKILRSLTPKTDDESYCFKKHISGVSKNYKELGNRLSEKGDKKSAIEMFEKADSYEKLFILLTERGNQ